jgi:hypothetical protein
LSIALSILTSDFTFSRLRRWVNKKQKVFPALKPKSPEKCVQGGILFGYHFIGDTTVFVRDFTLFPVVDFKMR